VEPHGTKSQKKKIVAVIPARYSSTRLEGKLLLPLSGEPIILRTVRQAASTEILNEVIVATDDERIAQVVRAAGHRAVITSPNHKTGTDRIAEAIDGTQADVIVNIQGDEPFISPETIESAVRALIESGADFATTCEAVESPDDVINPNVVKVVTDNAGFALYFSRSPIPFPRHEVLKHGDIATALEREPTLLSKFRKHTGLYVFTSFGLSFFTTTAQTPNELEESLEQLRIIENGHRIRVVETDHKSIGIDTREDYERAKRMLGEG
jgi:3-deoxy-manno-octulosonate cytidylyltransferase (CMP-KDO synthetase)